MSAALPLCAFVTFWVVLALLQFCALALVAVAQLVCGSIGFHWALVSSALLLLALFSASISFLIFSRVR